jgi:hypothetical protein
MAATTAAMVTRCIKAQGHSVALRDCDLRHTASARAEPGAIAIASVVLLVGIVLLARGVIVSSYTHFIVSGHVHAAASHAALLIAFVVLLALFGGGKKSGGSSGK